MTGRITALEVQKRDRERVSVYLDDRFAFGLPAIVAARLKRGQFLSEAEVEALQEEAAVEGAYNRVLDYLGFRPRSRAEVIAYLQRREVPERQASSILDRLERAGLLDDDAFAQFWVENRERFHPRGPRALRYELRRKGIGNEAIEQALGSVDSLASAYQAAEKKARQLDCQDRPAFYRKLVEYLARRGFDYEIAQKVADRYWAELGPGD